jgi:hypothetical protein
MPPFAPPQNQDGSAWEPPAADSRLAKTAGASPSGVFTSDLSVSVEVKNHVWGEHATEFLATGTAVRRLAAEHKLPETTPKPTFTLGLDH